MRGCVRIKSHSCFHSETLYPLQRPVKVDASFIVHTQILYSQIFEILKISVWIYDHKMSIQWLFGSLGYSLDYRKTIRDVWYENTIHDIKVN
ncbi:hypothetical protein SDC9_197765 [bioreactor metagenome]|uniref:Uncharacterized protein n=1 Tax=bioreactor metagenome TaxID=1076179 RepID=A0A645II36_9ZZZZ